MPTGRINKGDYVRATCLNEVYQVAMVLPNATGKLCVKLMRADGTCLGWDLVSDLVKVKRFKKVEIWVEV
jgi:3,4-dihydroxy-2-butanone 4-phosphate synthase